MKSAGAFPELRLPGHGSLNAPPPKMYQGRLFNIGTAFVGVRGIGSSSGKMPTIHLPEPVKASYSAR